VSSPMMSVEAGAGLPTLSLSIEKHQLLLVGQQNLK